MWERMGGVEEGWEGHSKATIRSENMVSGC